MPHSSDTTILFDAEPLRNGPVLLAFSHGLDSTALFYLLEAYGIVCDLALVNYGLREGADQEEEAARRLAERHGCRIHVARAPRWGRDFERNARRFRYDFFEELIEREGYRVLLTAHQLNDRFEWLLMRLARGAGAVELAGMEREGVRVTPGGSSYRLVRPLIDVPRAALKAYLEERGYRYYRDESNEDGSNERGRLRRFTEQFMQEHVAGIARSFRYLEKDRRMLRGGWRLLVAVGLLRVLHLETPEAAARAADEQLKELGYLLSGAERRRVERGESLVAGRRWIVERCGALLYLAPYLPGTTMPKTFREACRRAAIPPKIRAYLFTRHISPVELEKMIKGV